MVDNSVIKDQFRIVELIYYPMPPQHPLSTRPYNINIDGYTMDRLKGTVEESGLAGFSPNMISSITSNIIRPSAHAIGTSINQQFMNEGRYIFLLKAQTLTYGGIIINTYIQGFTNGYGISTVNGTNNATAAPDMVHTINSVIETSYSEWNTAEGMRVKREKLQSVYDVLRGDRYNELYLLRPKDVLSNVETMMLNENLNEVYNGHIDPSIMGDININGQNNAGTTFNVGERRVETSKSLNSIGTSYISNIVNDGIKEAKRQQINIEMVSPDSLQFGAGATNSTTRVETPLSHNRFIKFLSMLESTRRVTGEFTYNSLMMVDANGASNFKLNLAPQTNMDMVMGAQTESLGNDWSGSDPVTIASHSLLYQAISLSSLYGLHGVIVEVDNTNMSMVGLDSIVVHDWKSSLDLCQQDMYILIDMFKERFLTEVVMAETQGGMLPLRTKIYVDLIGTSKLYIEFAGYQGEWYTLPTIVSSFASPVLTPDAQSRDFTSNMINTLINEIADTTVKYAQPNIQMPGMQPTQPMQQPYTQGLIVPTY